MTKKILNLLNFLLSVSAIATLIWFHGYKYVPEHSHGHQLYLHICILYFFVQYVLRGYLSGNISVYLRQNKFENFLFMVLIIEFVLTWLGDLSLFHYLLRLAGLQNHDYIFILSLHIWILLIVGVELGKASGRSTIWKLQPPILFILSFVILIIVGSSFLMLPEMTTSGEGMNFQDALFTSISATCVTGLTVVDTATFFTLKGKILIMILIQIGGLNIIAFATYFISFFRKNIENSSDHNTIKELLHTDNLERNRKMIKEVIITSFVIEFIGAIILFNQWGPGVEFSDHSERMFFSVFHAVSAFNNAGFTLFTDGFTNSAVQNAHLMHVTVAALIVFGGLGFTTLKDFWRLIITRKKWTKFQQLPLQSKIAVNMTAILILVGAVVFYFSEIDYTLENHSESSAIITSFFQSITCRTAGFNTVDFSEIGYTFFTVAIILMFIGASSGSTGGGIKTSTFYVLVKAIFNQRKLKTKGKNLFLSKQLIQKSMQILIYSILLIGLSMVVLTFSEKFIPFKDLLFEEFSAYGTVGLTTGITSELSYVGKTVIMINMFIGRIGPIAIAYALIKSVRLFHETEDQKILVG